MVAVMGGYSKLLGNDPFSVEVSESESIYVDESEDFMIADAVFNYMNSKNREGRGNCKLFFCGTSSCEGVAA